MVVVNLLSTYIYVYIYVSNIFLTKMYICVCGAGEAGVCDHLNFLNDKWIVLQI